MCFQLLPLALIQSVLLNESVNCATYSISYSVTYCWAHDLERALYIGADLSKFISWLSLFVKVWSLTHSTKFFSSCLFYREIWGLGGNYSNFRLFLKKVHFILKIPNKRELQQTVYNHYVGIYFKDFKKWKIKIYKRTVLTLAADITLPCDFPSKFRKSPI